MIERALRWAATAIAIAAVIDPPLTVSARARPRISVAAASVADRPQSAVVRDRLAGDLRRDFDVTDGFDAASAASVIVGVGLPEEPPPDAAKISTVTTAPSPRSVWIDSVDAPAEVLPATVVRIAARVRGFNMRGKKSAVVVRARGAEVGRVDHVWTGDDETWTATIDAVAVGEPPFSFLIDADGDRARVVADAAAPLRVLVFEARPSWASAFARRALEDDPRFEVSGISDVAPRATVATGPAPELSREPSRFDVVIAGGLDRISAPSLAALHRFVRARGGVVILVPDEKIPDHVRRELLPAASFHETLLERPGALQNAAAMTTPSIETSELLEADPAPAGSVVFARAAASHRPVVWQIADGDGGVIVCGAMDAWRYRGGKDAAFERFWRSLVSGAAMSAQPAISVTTSPRRARIGQRIQVTARVRTLERDQAGAQPAIAAWAGSTPFRLWPDARAGEFSGSFVVSSAADDLVVASLRGTTTSGRTRLTIDDNARDPSTLPPLSLLSRTHGGIDVSVGRLGDLERHLRETIAAGRIPTRVHPMRSPWWIAPFAACLTAEWWLRRRRGER